VVLIINYVHGIFTLLEIQTFQLECKSKALSLVSTFLKMGLSYIFNTPFMRDAILHQPNTHCNRTTNWFTRTI